MTLDSTWIRFKLIHVLTHLSLCSVKVNNFAYKRLVYSLDDYAQKDRYVDIMMFQEYPIHDGDEEVV